MSIEPETKPKCLLCHTNRNVMTRIRSEESHKDPSEWQCLTCGKVWPKTT